MGGVASSVYARVTRKQELTPIIMLGLDAAGKTTILYKVSLGEVQTTIPTIGFNVENVEYAGKTSMVSFTTWDVGGRDKIRGLWRHYYQHAQALVFVVDSTDRDRCEDAAEEMTRVLEEDMCQDWPLLVFANKQDLPTAMSVAELTDKLKLHALRNRTWCIKGSCAMTGDGLHEGLDWLSQTMQEKKTGKAQEKSEHHAQSQHRFGEQDSKLTEATESDAETDVPESVGIGPTDQEM